MWQSKELKKKARTALRRNYWRAVIVCLVLTFIAGAYSTMASGKFGVTLNSAMNEPFPILFNYNVLSNTVDGVTGETGELPHFLQASEGILASLFNNITKSGSFLFGILNSLNQGFFRGHLMQGVIILVGAALSFFGWLFVGNILRVSECRFFLENHLYPQTRPNRLLYVYKIHKTRHVAKVMFLRALYIVLWSFTIVGGFIKAYEYRLVPYIMAENPGLPAKKAFALSKQMMRGNKWHTFLLDLSFLPWELLAAVTLHFLGFLFVNPYRAATGAELYLSLREHAFAAGIEGSENMNDVCLAAVPEGEYLEYPQEALPYPEYPSRRWLTVEYHRNYSLTSLVLLFFTFSIVGWLWEVALFLFNEGLFVNRGVFWGPWLPIYGSGGVLILILLRRFADKPWLLFSLTVVLCGVVEYGTSWYLETFKGAKWWDYTGFFLNINGRVCLEGLLVFGVGGCLFVYLLGPIMDDLYRKIPQKVKVIACTLLVVCFLSDVVYSNIHPHQGEGITEDKAGAVLVQAESVL